MSHPPMFPITLWNNAWAKTLLHAATLKNVKKENAKEQNEKIQKKWKNEKWIKMMKNEEQKEGPKGYLFLPPKTGPKIDFSHKNCQEKS